MNPLFLRSLQIVLSLTLFFVLQPSLAASKSLTGDACTEALRDSVEVESRGGFFTDTTGFDDIDWQNYQGWGRLRQRPVFSPNEVALIRKKLEKEPRSEISLFRNGVGGREIFIKYMSSKIGTAATENLDTYLAEIDDEIAQRTPAPYEMRVFVRKENSIKFEAGHTHPKGIVTITRAELGEGSWIAPGGFGSPKQSFADPDAASVFTDQVHGGTSDLEPRLLIIVFIRFLNRP